MNQKNTSQDEFYESEYDENGVEINRKVYSKDRTLKEEYDFYNGVISNKYEYHNNGDLKCSSEFDENGNIKESLYFDENDILISKHEYHGNDIYTEYKYNVHKDVIYSAKHKGSDYIEDVHKYDYIYNENGRVLIKEHYYYDVTFRQFILSETSKFEYDDWCRTGSESIYNGNGTLITKYEFEFDPITGMYSGQKYEYGYSGSIVSTCKCDYDLNGNVINEYDYQDIDYDEGAFDFGCDYDEESPKLYYHTPEDIASGINPTQREIDEIMQEMLQERTIEEDKQNKTFDNE